MNTKKILLILLLTINSAYGQVGIQTEKPQSELDINGDMNVSGKVYTSGTDNSIGDPGSKNKALTSNGDNAAVTWEEVKIPLGYEGGLYLTTVEAISDTSGLNLAKSGSGIYNEFSSLDSEWKEIPGLTKAVTVSYPNNKIHVQFQTTAQINFTGSASFACGVFVNNQLRGARVDVVKGPSGSYNVFNINTSLDNLTTGNYTFKIACRGRTYSPDSENSRVAIGSSNISSNLNPSMAQSSLNLFVLEDLL